MQIVPFCKEHVEQAQRLALENYEEERKAVPQLPQFTRIPLVEAFAANGLGVAALEQGTLIGYLGCWDPWNGGFDTFDTPSLFSPVNAHAAIKEDRIHIYQRMYEEAGKLWHEKQILAQGIALYGHDHDAIQAFFEYGFGKRLADRIRRMESFTQITNTKMHFEELSDGTGEEIRSLRKELNRHLKQSPCFMQSTEKEDEAWLDKAAHDGRRIFTAKDGGRIAAYIEICAEGETFVSCHEKMRSICGAYCRPEYRGTKVIQDVLETAIRILNAEGYTLLGVDHESFNPTANRFWKKYFPAYTCSVVRRMENWSEK